MPKESTLNIVDLGDKLFDSSVIDIIEQFEIILVIIDPMIPDLLNSIEMLEKIKSLQSTKSVRIEYIVNKFNSGVDKSSLLNFLDIKPICYIPYISLENIYKAVYDGDIPYNIFDVKCQLFKPFNKLFNIVIPKEIYEQCLYKNKKIIYKLKKQLNMGGTFDEEVL